MNPMPVAVVSQNGALAMMIDVQFVPTMTIQSAQPMLVPSGICVITEQGRDAEGKEIEGQTQSKWLIRPLGDLIPLVSFQAGPPDGAVEEATSGEETNEAAADGDREEAPAPDAPVAKEAVG